MGLRQEAETSLGNQSGRCLPHPAVAGLPWLRGGLAGVLTFAGAHEMLPDRAFAQSLPQSTEVTTTLSSPLSSESSTINPLTLELSSKVSALSLEASQLGIEDLTGELLTNAWIDEEGNRNIVYRNIWFQVGMDGRLTVADALIELDQSVLDQEYSGIDRIPPKSDQPISPDQLDPDVQSVITTLSQSLGFNAQVTGSESYGPYKVFRIGDKLTIIQILEGPQAGQIQLGNIGLQLLQTPNVPEYVVLSPLPFATGGGTIPTPEQTAQLSPEVNRAGLKLEYKSSGGRYIVKNSPDADYGFRPPSQEGADALDQAIAPLDKTLSVIPNKNLTTAVYGDAVIFNKDPMSGGITKMVIIMHPAVNPDDPNRIELQYNKITAADIKIDPDYLKEQNGQLQAGLGSKISEAVYGARWENIKDPKIREDSNILAGNITNTFPPALELVVT